MIISILKIIAIVACVFMICNMQPEITIKIKHPLDETRDPLENVQAVQGELDKAQDEITSVSDLVRNLNNFMLGGDD